MRVPTWFFLGSYNGFSIEKNQHQLSWHLLGNAGRIHFLQLNKFSKAWIFPIHSMKFSYSRICEKRVSLWYTINPVDFLSSSVSVQCICRVPSFCHVFQLIPGWCTKYTDCHIVLEMQVQFWPRVLSAWVSTFSRWLHWFCPTSQRHLGLQVWKKTKCWINSGGITREHGRMTLHQTVDWVCRLIGLWMRKWDKRTSVNEWLTVEMD